MDSGSVVHVCSESDTPGYLIEQSPGSKVGQQFLMGDGGETPNLGQKHLSLQSENDKFTSCFQVAAVTRPLMSVGKICDNDHTVEFDKVRAIVRDKNRQEICTFTRQPGGLYTAKLKLKAPGFARPE